jgi:hypothetical protein
VWGEDGGGRIIAANIHDGYKKWDFLKKIITKVDIELKNRCPLPLTKGMIYLAIAFSKIIGVCVAEALEDAIELDPVVK